MRIVTDDIYRRYADIVVILFFTFLSGVLSFGRPFSILHINFFGIKFFITELFLLMSLPVIFLNGWNRFKIPEIIKISFAIFFLLGCYHFFIGILIGNLFALRDIVLCGYLLFLPLTLMVFSKKKALGLFIAILIISNFINLFIGWLMLHRSCSIFNFRFLINQTRGFNLGLYYGMSLSFLASFLPFISNRKVKILMILLMAMNIQMLIIFSLRTLWFALLSLVVYFILIQRLFFLKIILKAGLILVPMSVLLFWVDYGNGGKNVLKESMISKFKMMAIFAANKPERSKIISKDNLTSNLSGEPKRSEIVAKDDMTSKLSGYDKANFFSMFWRFEIWKQSIDFGLKSPLFGMGFGVYPHYAIYRDPYAKKMGYLLEMPTKIDVDSGVTPAHNHIVTIFFKMGLIGLALFIFMNIYTLLYGIRYIDKANDGFLRCFLIGSLGAFVLWHAMALFFDVIDSPPTTIFLWILMGLIFAAVEVDKRYSSKKASS